MELILVAVSLASLICNVALVRRFLTYKTSTLEVTEIETLPLIEAVIESVIKPEPPATVGNGSSWVNRTGIQQGENTVPPAAPVQPIKLPPLARPGGFV